MAKKLLIANRGEIACRIISSCKKLGLQTVAVYSEADAHAMHVELADEAVLVGPPPARESYLRVDAILDAARRTGADLVHPGYGFLAENADFAQAVMDAGLGWVGPSPASIIDMGDKERAREIARLAGVPILPGSQRFALGQTEAVMDAAQQVGYPLLVKAAAGGGGIGMRRVDEATQLLSVVEATQSMAGKAFGDSSVYLERYVAAARHIEVQVFGFGDGQGVHLYDRDCSVQRRFQKIIEEAPAPGVPEAVRAQLYGAALALVAQQRYSGAGTVEFIYDSERQQAYFLEMNTRIQVEHPTTEMVTGVDLVAWQILQALGELAPVSQDAIALNGHAVECRLYAERPEKNFLPSPGLIETLAWPMKQEGLRVDTGVRAGDRVTPYYDPLVAKLIAHGIDRSEAIARLRLALEGLTVEGLSTNAEFLHRVLSDADFSAGGVTTAYVGHFLEVQKQRSRKAG
ncbi:acetyl-CoA carboxylase biotin carboxylase subunit [Pollutimonas thiosulfatoxidans]|uniref:Acetyl-CoA carboxylase biotin carboxylase subunit n=1 Tax=Pollutimonas thiosulfatoxidans TaxID=2028345 RepID=A0A410GEX8_9BURK|nr:biotin carboxylase N-terminal domain-containing protein [Pollutimonas thiosulfatoxidans]QAA94854.1 acetyl-CoA carboxylase biotin carboxylase subunit [Pollutimonas thiosulfatoxidans]